MLAEYPEREAIRRALLLYLYWGGGQRSAVYCRVAVEALADHFELPERLRNAQRPSDRTEKETVWASRVWNARYYLERKGYVCGAKEGPRGEWRLTKQGKERARNSVK